MRFGQRTANVRYSAQRSKIQEILIFNFVYRPKKHSALIKELPADGLEANIKSLGLALKDFQMSRIISYRAATSPQARVGEADAQAANEGGDGGQEEKGDAYLQRVAKYIPAEVVGFFIFVNALLKGEVERNLGESINGSGSNPTVSELISQAAQSASLAGIDVQTISWIVIGISFVLIPIYLWMAHDPSNKDEWLKLNIFVALLAFPVWAYAVEAVAFRSFYDGTLAAIALAVFTIISGVVSPRLADKLGANFGR